LGKERPFVFLSCEEGAIVGKTTDKLVADVQSGLDATKGAINEKESVLSALLIHHAEIERLVKAQQARLKVIAGAQADHHDQLIDSDAIMQELESAIDVNTTLWTSALKKKATAVANVKKEFANLQAKNRALGTYLVEKDKKTKLAIFKKSLKPALAFWRETNNYIDSLT
jgi:hypothetical protein